MSNLRYLIDGAIESLFVRLGGLGEAAQFPNKLKRRSPDFFLRGGRTKVVKGFDISAHARLSTINRNDQLIF